MKTLCIFGTGGFARETAASFMKDCEYLQDDEMTIYFVGQNIKDSERIMGLRVIDEIDFNSKIYSAVIAIADCQIRRFIVEVNLSKNAEFSSIFSASSISHRDNIIGEGAIVCAGVILTCNINIGKHCQLNLNTTIGHDCIIGDYFTTAPGVNISGKCTIGNCVYIGTNAAIRQGVSICDNVIIGMGSVVLNDITEPGTYVGNPLRKLKIEKSVDS